MEANFSGEELVIKTRKPYTITKQRERWTEEEHNRFLEALKLYGRAWQKIEDHIGTKTAVQIRSHAQKFFTKLEKGAHAKGIPVGQALNIDIPPPRPKRKPSNPYPRKTGNGTPTSQAGAKDGKLATPASSLHCKKPDGEGKPLNAEEYLDDCCSDCFSLLQDALCSCSSVSSGNENCAPNVSLRNSCTFQEFLPLPKEAIKDNGTNKPLNLEKKFCRLHGKSVQGMEQNGINGISPTDEQGTQNYPRHVPVHVLEGSSVTCTFSPPPDMLSQDSVFHPIAEIHGIPNMSNQYASATSPEHQNDAPRANYQTLHTFHPGFAPVTPTQEDYKLFSNLIVSTLLQNPAVHAAATFAASFWPYANVDNPADSSRSFPHRQRNSPPSLAAIAVATVTAAAAWWATQGLLPLCAPFQAAVTCPPPSTTDTWQNPAAEIDPKETNHQIPTLQDQDSPSKPATSSSDSEESEGTKLQTGPKPDCNGLAMTENEIHDSNEAKNRKQVDRSSCESNTPSSDVETDALEKHQKDCVVKETDAVNPLASESSTHHSKSSSNLSDSWKEVSEEVLEQGRLAFQALFSREVLPQSFSPPYAIKDKGNQKENNREEEKLNASEKDGDVSALDLNFKIQSTSSNHQEEKKNTLPANENKVGEGLLAFGLGNRRLKARKTGFKPYKRCSVEAKENRVVSTTTGQADEKGPKRIRLEGKAST